MNKYYSTTILVTVSGPTAKTVSQCARKIAGGTDRKTIELLRLKNVKQENVLFEIRTLGITLHATAEGALE
ncbi:MAG: hypothetical protein D4R57_00545 [Verrucomicrobiales bacterium]|nr:MAG: hypothetical protein D4R57_00545 [Verrucomicrobiales bacterium]